MSEIKCPFVCDHNLTGMCNKKEIEIISVIVYDGYEPVCGDQISESLRNSLR